MDLVLSRNCTSYCVQFRGPSTVSRASLAVRNIVDLVLSRSFMSYCILFWGMSTVSRAFVAFNKTLGLGPFWQVYELLHIVLGSIDSFEGIPGIYQIGRASCRERVLRLV